MKQPDLEVIAKNAVNWILSTTQKNGMIPYIITPPQTNGFGKVYQPITYSAESFIDVYMRYPDMRATIQSGLNATIKFLVANQSSDGSWGFWQKGNSAAHTGDSLRSPRALSLLQLAYENFGDGPDYDHAAIGAAIQKNAAFCVNAATRAPFGIGAPHWLALPTGFVGLAVADLIQPWSTFLPQPAGTPSYKPHPLGFD